jgi:hypothetical protein
MADKPIHSLRKPGSSIPPAHIAAAFINAEPASVAATPAVAQPSAPRLVSVPTPATETIAPPPKAAPRTKSAPSGNRKTLQRADGRQLRKLTLYMDPELAQRLAVFCAQAERDLSDVTQEAVGNFLAINKKNT